MDIRKNVNNKKIFKIINLSQKIMINHLKFKRSKKMQ